MNSCGQRVQRVSVVCVAACMPHGIGLYRTAAHTFGGETNAEVLLHARGAMCARPRRYRMSALHGAACIDAMMH